MNISNNQNPLLPIKNSPDTQLASKGAQVSIHSFSKPDSSTKYTVLQKVAHYAKQQFSQAGFLYFPEKIQVKGEKCYSMVFSQLTHKIVIAISVLSLFIIPGIALGIIFLNEKINHANASQDSVSESQKIDAWKAKMICSHKNYYIEKLATLLAKSDFDINQLRFEKLFIIPVEQTSNMNSFDEDGHFGNHKDIAKGSLLIYVINSQNELDRVNNGYNDENFIKGFHGAEVLVLDERALFARGLESSADFYRLLKKKI